MIGRTFEWKEVDFVLQILTRAGAKPLPGLPPHRLDPVTLAGWGKEVNPGQLGATNPGEWAPALAAVGYLGCREKASRTWPRQR